MLSERLNQLIEKISQTRPGAEILAAKKSYQQATGDIFEDDKSYEARMGSFLEWYLLEWNGENHAMSPLQAFVEMEKDSLSEEDRGILESFSHNRHGLFLVLKVGPGGLWVRELFEDKKYRVQASQSALLLNKNDIVETRLIHHRDVYHFSDNFCYHPKSTTRFIQAKVKAIRELDNRAREQLAAWEKQYKALDKKWNECVQNLEKINAKLEKTEKEAKREKLMQERDGLQSQARELDEQKTALQGQIADWRLKEIRVAMRQRHYDLIRRFSYMSLKWERSRKIDIDDIYRD